MNKSILDSYHSNKGFSFGGKHLLYENYPNINEINVLKIYYRNVGKNHKEYKLIEEQNSFVKLLKNISMMNLYSII